jgi:hypothetical protein
MSETLEYVFMGSGRFSVERGFEDVFMNLRSKINQQNITDAIKIHLPASLFNSKLLGDPAKPYGFYDATGTLQDFNSDGIFDASGGLKFGLDEITITNQDIVNTSTSVYDVSSVATLYSDFNQYVTNWLSSGNFINLFDASSTIPSAAFSRADLWKLFFMGTSATNSANYLRNDQSRISGNNVPNPPTWDPDMSLTGYPGQYVSCLSGSLTVSNINDLLVSAQTNNYFNNRVNNAANPTDVTTIDISGGFLPGDVIYIPDGLTINLNVNILQNGIAYSSGGLYNTLNPTNNTNLLTSIGDEPAFRNQDGNSLLATLGNQTIVDSVNNIDGSVSAYTNIYQSVKRNLVITLVEDNFGFLSDMPGLTTLNL